MDAVGIERLVSFEVRILNGKVNRNGNYFVSAVVQLVTSNISHSNSSNSITSSLILPTNIQRTDVCKHTSQLIFRNQTFKFTFRLQETVASSSEGATAPKATLILRLFEINPSPKTQLPGTVSSGPIADAIYELQFPSSGPSLVATKELSLVPCHADSPRSNGSTSSDEPSLEEFGTISISLKLVLKTNSKNIPPRLSLSRVEESDSDAGSPRSVDSGSSSTREQPSPEPLMRRPPSMFPTTGSLPGSALYKRLVHGSNPKTSDTAEPATTFTNEAESGLLGKNHSIRTDDYVFFVRCYGYCNLANPTRCFLTVKTTRDVAENRPARAGTMSSPVARNFVWQEPFTVDVGRRERSTSPGAEKSRDQPLGLFISLIDSARKSYLGRCILPVDRFVAGEQYNIALVLDEMRQSYVLVSILLHPSLSFQTSLFLKYPDLCRLEVFLHGVRRPRAHNEDAESNTSPSTSPDRVKEFNHPFGSNVIAALHVEEDFTAYLRRVQESPPRPPFQSLSLASADAPLRVKPSLYQISPPSQLSLHPQWHCLLEFTLTTDELNAPSGAIVIELYDMDFPKDGVGSVRFCGWAAVPLRSLSKPGLRDGDIVSESATLHNLPWGPSSRPGASKRGRGSSLLRKSTNMPPLSSLIDCEYSNTCSRHDYTIAMQSRRWVSRSFVRHLLRIQSEGGLTSTPARLSRDLSDIPPGTGLGGTQPAPLLRSQSQSNSQSIIDWAANRKKAGLSSGPTLSSPMSSSTPSLPHAQVPSTSSPSSASGSKPPRRTSAAPAPIGINAPSAAPAPIGINPPSAVSAPSFAHISTPAPMLRSKSKSSAVIVTEKPQPSGAMIGPSPPVMLARLKQIQQMQAAAASQRPSPPAKLNSAATKSHSAEESDEYKSCEESPFSSPDKSPSEPASSQTAETASGSYSMFDQSSEAEDEPPYVASRRGSREFSRRGSSAVTADNTDEDTSSDHERTIDSEIMAHMNSPPPIENPHSIRRRGSPEVPPIAGTRAPVVSPAPVRAHRTSSGSQSRNGSISPSPSASNLANLEHVASRPRTGSAASSGRPPLHVVVDPHKAPSASPSPKSPTGHAVPLRDYFRAGSTRVSESSDSDSETEPTPLNELGFFATPPGSPMQLMSVLSKVEKMLTKKLRKKQKTINELRDQLNRAHEDSTRLRSDNAILVGQNQVLREEMERMRRERDTLERRAEDSQAQFRQFVKSIQQNAKTAGILSSSSASSSLNSWNAQALSAMVPPPSSPAQRRLPSYDGYSEDDTSDFEAHSPARMPPAQSPLNARPHQRIISVMPPTHLTSLPSPVHTSHDTPSLVVEVGSERSPGRGDDTDASARADTSMEYTQTYDDYDDEGSTSEHTDTSPIMRRSEIRSAPQQASARTPIKQSFSFSSNGSSNSSVSRDSMLTFPGSVGSNRSLSSPRVSGLPNWSDDESETNADDLASNSSAHSGRESNSAFPDITAELESDLSGPV